MFLRNLSSFFANFRYGSISCTNLSRFVNNRSNITCTQYYSTLRSKTYYSVLGVKREATNEEIKEAYYCLSKKYHPDLNIGDKTAESKILEINEAFEVLGNKVKKENYDDKMFPKVWEKKPYIYEHDAPSERPNHIFCRTFKNMSYGLDQFTKHRRGELKRKHRHSIQKLVYSKSQGNKRLSKLYFKG